MAKINEAQVLKAVNALLKWKKLQSKNQSLLSDEAAEQEEETEAEVLEENFIYLMLTLKKIPPKELTTPHKILLPHPLFHPLESFSNICLIIDDRPKKPLNSKSNLYAETMQKNKPHLSKSKLDVETVQKKIKAEGIPITKVLKFSKLKAEYKSFEAKRELYGSYELFLTDKRVVHLLPGLLGKQFYKKKRKVPVPVDLRGNSSWKEEIERACASSLLCLGNGTCSVLKVGRGGMESGEVMENVLAAIEGIAEFVPKKLGGVRAFHLKFSDSLALPVYENLPDSKIEDLKEPNATRKN
nr:ribosomal L1 domain-containing protein 1-like [Nicotiana tomentosiformis]